MYVTGNPKTKKALKEAVAASQTPVYRDPDDAHDDGHHSPPFQGAPVRVFSPGPFPANANGVEFVKGPQYPAAHTWYAKVQVEDGEIVKVLS